MWLTTTFALDLAEEVVSMAVEGAEQNRGMPWWFWLLFILLILVLWGLWWLIGPGARRRARRSPHGLDTAWPTPPSPPAPSPRSEAPETSPTEPPVSTGADAAQPQGSDRPPETAVHEPPPPEVHDTGQAATAPTPQEPPAEVGAGDDLSRIAGIGPKVAQILQEAGIRTFAQLAATDVDELRRILREAGLRFMDPSTWPEQAGLAAQGDWDALAQLQSQLKRGRRPQ